MSDTVLKRVVRRETHSPRTVVAVIVLILVALAAIYAGIEIVLRLLSASPLLVAPRDAISWLEALPDSRPSAAVVAVGVVTAILGLLLVGLALAPGRRPKHRLGGAEYAVVVDNGVIASSVAEQVRRELDLSRGAVVVGIGHRGADVTVRPEPGQPVEKALIRSVAETELASYELSPRVRVRARIRRPAERTEAS